MADINGDGKLLFTYAPLPQELYANYTDGILTLSDNLDGNYEINGVYAKNSSLILSKYIY